MAMYRAEKGEFNVASIVFSGHHWRGDDGVENARDNRDGATGIWGEIPGLDHEYDNNSDFFSLLDVAALRPVFPKA